MSSLQVNGIVEESVVDGPGLRYVVFTQGCPHGCPGCHNPETHSVDGGYWLSTKDIIRQFTENPLLTGITFSGGEPFLQPKPLGIIAEQVRGMGKTVFTYTGYTFEQLLERGRGNAAIRRLLYLTDTLVDGPYVERLRSLDLLYRGSANQRLLDRSAREALADQPICHSHVARNLPLFPLKKIALPG